MTTFQILKSILTPPAPSDCSRMLWGIATDLPHYEEAVLQAAESIGGIEHWEAAQCGAVALQLQQRGCTPAQWARAVARLLRQDASLAPQLRLIESLMA